MKLPPYGGGMEKHIYYLTKKQAKNFNIKVFFNVGNKIFDSDKKFKFLSYYKIRPQSIGFLLFYFEIILYLIFKREKFDIIHIHGDWSSLLFVKLLKYLTKAKTVVFSFHGFYNQNKFTHKYLLIKLLKNIDTIFVTGYESYEKLTDKIKNKKIIWQYSGINKEFLLNDTSIIDKRLHNKEFKIVTTANLYKKKNLEFIIDIADFLINKKKEKIKFYLIGEGPEKNNLINKIKLLNLNNNVILLGKKNHKEIAEIYKNMNLFLFSSLEEGTPTVILEAIASGLPVITYNVGKIEKLVKNNVNGFIINDLNKNNFVNKILLLKANNNLYKKIANNNIKLGKNFLWENIAQKISINY